MKQVIGTIIRQSLDLLKSVNVGKFLMKLVIVLLLIGGCVGGCSYLNNKLGMKDDNPLEEIIEAQIENQTGLDFDLSPGSPEK